MYLLFTKTLWGMRKAKLKDVKSLAANHTARKRQESELPAPKPGSLATMPEANSAGWQSRGFESEVWVKILAPTPISSLSKPPSSDFFSA
jgi:hypothetical protein